MTNPSGVPEVAVGRRVKRLLIAFSAVLVATPGLLVAYALYPWAPMEDGRVCRMPRSVPAGVVGDAAAAPGGGGLRVIDNGFSQFGGGVSVGAVVENSSRRAAYRVRVTVRALDAAGVAATRWPQDVLFVQEIPVLLPGERVGLGAHSEVNYVESIQMRERVRIASVRFDLGTVRWLPYGETDSPFAPDSPLARVTARVTSTPSSDDDDVHYSVESGYCREISDRGVAVVYRDSAGAIVGGELRWSAVGRCRPERIENQFRPFSVPPAADHGRTEAYQYCDPVPAEPGEQSPSPGVPVN